MQQAYRAIRVVAETQTIRMVLSPEPDSLMLMELEQACTALTNEGGDGIKAVVLDFNADQSSTTPTDDKHALHAELASATAAVKALAQPVLAVVRASPSAEATALIQATDLTLVANAIRLRVPDPGESDDAQTANLSGEAAARMSYVTWSAPAPDLDEQMHKVLEKLRAQSAVALRLVKASARFGATLQPVSEGDPPATQTAAAAQLAALREVNDLYLTQVMRTHDAHEGLRAFLEKRKPEWKNI